MPLDVPNLDDRTWTQLVDDARALISRVAPAWTDHNVHDPGITLLDHAEAEQWFRSFYEDRYPYNTYFYAPLDYYVALFSRHGIPLRLLNSPSGDQESVEVLAQQWEAIHRHVKGLGDEFPDKPRELIAEIGRRADDVGIRESRCGTSPRIYPVRLSG